MPEPTVGATLASAIGLTDTAIVVDDVTQFPGSGTVAIDGEVLSYSGKEFLADMETFAVSGAHRPGKLLNVIRTGNATSHQAGIPVILVGRTCTGDCERSNEVSVVQLVAMVNVALGGVDVSDCPPGDANGDWQITVDELLQAVNNALSGCER